MCIIEYTVFIKTMQNSSISSTRVWDNERGKGKDMKMPWIGARRIKTFFSAFLVHFEH